VRAQRLDEKFNMEVWWRVAVTLAITNTALQMAKKMGNFRHRYAAKFLCIRAVLRLS
jgi:hypothetical protein